MAWGSERYCHGEGEADRGIFVNVHLDSGLDITGTVGNFPEFPITADAFEPSLEPFTDGGTFGGFLTILDLLAKGNASVVYSTYLDPITISVDAEGKAYLVPAVTPLVNSYQSGGATGVAILAPPIPSDIPTPPPPPTATPTRTRTATPTRTPMPAMP